MKKRSTVVDDWGCDAYRDSTCSSSPTAALGNPGLKALLQEVLDHSAKEPLSTGPSTVYTAMYIDQIWDLDEKTESFKAKFSIFCRWQCPPQHAEEHLLRGADLLDVAWKPAWEPMFRVRDSLSSSMSLKIFNSEKDQQGVVWINGMYVMSVCVAEAFDLHAFPFDVQDLNLAIRIDNVKEMKPLELPKVNSHDGHELEDGARAPRHSAA